MVVTLCSDADDNCPILPPNVKKEHWGFDDPEEKNGQNFNVLEMKLEKNTSSFNVSVSLYLKHFKNRARLFYTELSNDVMLKAILKLMLFIQSSQMM